MGETAKQLLVLDLNFNLDIHPKGAQRDDGWMPMEDGDGVSESTSDEFSEQDSTNSNVSSYSSDLAEDASSSPSSTLASHVDGPLYELSELMAQLPIKRGLSKFYQGKSQSYASLASVKCIEDLAKRGTPYRSSKMKPCKSFAGGIDAHKSYGPKATIAKKGSRGSFLSNIGKRSSLVSGCYTTSIPLQNDLLGTKI